MVVRSTTAPSAFDTTFWVTTITSSTVSGRTPPVRWIAFAMKTPRSSPSRISGIPSSATTRTSRSADTETTCSFGLGRFDEDEIVGGVEIDGQRALELDDGRSAGPCRGYMRTPAAAPEREIDDIGRSQPEGVGPGEVAIRH